MVARETASAGRLGSACVRITGRRMARSKGIAISTSAPSRTRGANQPRRSGAARRRIAGAATGRGRSTTGMSRTAATFRTSALPASLPWKIDATGSGSRRTKSPRCSPSIDCSPSGSSPWELRPMVSRVAPVAPPSNWCAESALIPLARATASAICDRARARLAVKQRRPLRATRGRAEDRSDAVGPRPVGVDSPDHAGEVAGARLRGGHVRQGGQHRRHGRRQGRAQTVVVLAELQGRAVDDLWSDFTVHQPQDVGCRRRSVHEVPRFLSFALCIHRAARGTPARPRPAVYGLHLIRVKQGGAR